MRKLFAVITLSSIIVLTTTLLNTTICMAAGAIPSSHAVLLPREQALALTQQCSRMSPEKKVTGSWDVSSTVIAQLEGDLATLSSQKSSLHGQSVQNPTRYFRQYAGVIINGKRYVYINALGTSDPPDFWRKQPAIVCDGGPAYWGMLYDPSSHRFSDLEFNGMV